LKQDTKTNLTSEEVTGSDQSDSNYGCNIISRDRVFGTYWADTEVKKCGADKGKALSVKEQLALAFYSEEKLKDL